jgi:Fic family protein
MSSRLSESNPYLRNAAARKRSVLKSVASSSAIEGIRAPFKQGTKTAAKPVSTSKRAGSIKR